MAVHDGSRLLIDLRKQSARENHLWPVHVARAADIEEQVSGLARGEPGQDGRREVSIVHPESTEPGLGLAPGIDVAFGLLLPGEQTRPRRHNASEVTMLLTGEAEVSIGERSFAARQRDVFNTPSMNIETIRNSGDADVRYVTYSSAAMLRKLEIYYQEFDPEPQPALESTSDGTTGKQIAGSGILIGSDGAQLLPYEYLVDPGFVDSKPLLWRWQDIAPHLPRVRDIGDGYTGRHLWILYNPATGSRSGTTLCFFATIAAMPPNNQGPSHRHTSAAINFILDGSGSSVVGDTHVEWEAGDIMLSAPGWAPHGHASGPDGTVILTIQDHPLQIGAEALVWEERGEIRTLGTQAGFDTNLAQLRGAK
jgi:gentisate 1,2-dioxygenase